MAASATGTPSTNFSFPKLNTSVDAPDGTGINSIVDDMDSKLLSRFVQSASAKSSNQVPIWNGSVWTWGLVNAANMTGASGVQFMGAAAGVPTWSTGGMYMIQDTTLGSPAANIDFNSIPQTYKHLLIDWQFATDNAALVDWWGIRLDSVSTASYNTQALFSNAAAVTGAEELSVTIGRAGLAKAATGTGGGSGWGQTIIQNYTNTTFIKGWATYFSVNHNGGATGGMYTGTVSGSYGSANAITRVLCAPIAGANFITGSRATLYGIG